MECKTTARNENTLKHGRHSFSNGSRPWFRIESFKNWVELNSITLWHYRKRRTLSKSSQLHLCVHVSAENSNYRTYMYSGNARFLSVAYLLRFRRSYENNPTSVHYWDDLSTQCIRNWHYSRTHEHFTSVPPINVFSTIRIFYLPQ